MDGLIDEFWKKKMSHDDVTFEVKNPSKILFLHSSNYI